MRKSIKNLYENKKRKFTLLVLAIIFITSFDFCYSTVVNAATSLNNPIIVKDDSMCSGQRVTYDCLYFGLYPQAEVVPSTEKETTIRKECRNGFDYIVDADLYNKLNSATDWDENGDAIIDGEKYRRIKVSELNEESLDNIHPDANGFFWGGEIAYIDENGNIYSDETNIPEEVSYGTKLINIPDDYHYFKYQPIKWRILSIDNDNALLLSDMVLDAQVAFSTDNWLSWLNGYTDRETYKNYDYSKNNFIDCAMSENEKEAILSLESRNNNKIFYLHELDMYTYNYGFIDQRLASDEARMAIASSYAKAKGISTGIGCGGGESNDNGVVGNNFLAPYCDYWHLAGELAAQNNGGFAGFYNLGLGGVRPALYLDLSKVTEYSYAGTVCSNNTITDSNGTILYKHEHNYEYVNTEHFAGCKTEGEVYKICACGHYILEQKKDPNVHKAYFYNREIKKYEFKEKTSIQNAKDATCEQDGYSGDVICALCEKTLSKGDVIPAISHKWDNGTVTKQPTATTKGIRTYKCLNTNCTTTKEEEIPATGIDESTTTESTTTESTSTESTNKEITKKKKQTISTAKIKSYKAKNLRKKKVVFKLKAKTTGNGKLTYKVTKYPKKMKKYISVSKTGKVTLKKNAKKGTYEITIKAAKTSKYNSAKKIIKIKVK